MTNPHDSRCEAHWNDGVCACLDRAERAAEGFWAEHPPTPGLIARLIGALR